MKRIILLSLALILPWCSALADDSEHAFLLCDGASQKDSAQSFSFTVTLDVSNDKVLNIGSGDGAVTEAFTDTEIVGKHDVGGGVTNRLSIDRADRSFTLTILRAKPTNENSTEVDDVYRGVCKPTNRAF